MQMLGAVKHQFSLVLGFVSIILRLIISFFSWLLIVTFFVFNFLR